MTKQANYKRRFIPLAVLFLTVFLTSFVKAPVFLYLILTGGDRHGA